MKIVIDEGHNRGQDQGAVDIGNENNMNIATGEKVITKLQALGHQILRILDKVPQGVSVSTSLADRVSAANGWGADLYVAIHANSGGGYGTEVWIGSESSRAIANRIVNNIAALGYLNRGVKVQGIDGPHLYVLKNTNMPALLVEQCFVDSQEDMNKWDAETMANAIVEGITGQTINNNKIGWIQESGVWYYYENNSKVINTWRKDSKGLWYFLGGYGAMVKGQWIKNNDGKWYFLKLDGVMATSQWIKWNNKQYWVDANGVMAANTIADGWTVGADGAWDGKEQIK